MALRPFHVAVAVRDLDEAREFYVGLLGCAEGRSAADWVDFNMYGHQYVCHRSEQQAAQPGAESAVDAKVVPVPHYGVVLDWADWEELAERLGKNGVSFLSEPAIRFQGQPGEQATFFVADPSGNVLEFKAMRDSSNLFSA